MYVTNHEMNGEPISEAPSIVVAHTRIIFTQPTENKPEQEKHYKHCVYIYICEKIMYELDYVWTLSCNRCGQVTRSVQVVLAL
jgi:hypothetical protein